MKLPAVPENADNAVIDWKGRQVQLTNLRKVFWERGKVTKGDLIRY